MIIDRLFHIILKKFFIQSSSIGQMMHTAMYFVRNGKIKGDYLEFGVMSGESFTATCYWAKECKLSDMRFHAFDSFEGYPKGTGMDSDASKSIYTVEYLKNLLKKNKIDLNKVTITKGWFDKTLNANTKKKLNIKKASAIFIDCGLYKSAVPIFDFITDYIQDGTLLLLGSYFSHGDSPKLGEQRAFREWLKKNPTIKATDFRNFRFVGNSFILHKLHQGR